MTRYQLILEYDGTPFVGWQRQNNGPSVQQALEEAIAGFCGETVTVFAAGRTDTGVHALGQVVHFDIEKQTAAATVRDALNHHLKPAPVAVLEAREAEPEFHARFDALGRHYLYRIVNRRAPLTLDRNRAWLVVRPLDADAMHEAAQALTGRHDFTTFRAAQCQSASPVKTLDAISVSRQLDEVVVKVSARSFLHHQVRSIVGSLAQVGLGRWPVEKIARILEARDRSACGALAPPHGLYLERVDY
ncbi:MAG: tRNA pseudouridine(38-40) synthase TruA [Alphaproteobacteria bacterium]